jgi:hypothetical protein
MKKNGTTLASQKLNRRLKNLAMCVNKLKENTLEVGLVNFYLYTLVMAMVHSSFYGIMEVEPPTNPQLPTAIISQVKALWIADCRTSFPSIHNAIHLGKIAVVS